MCFWQEERPLFSVFSILSSFFPNSINRTKGSEEDEAPPDFPFVLLFIHSTHNLGSLRAKAKRSLQWSRLAPGDISGQVTLCGAVPCIPGQSAASLASTHKCQHPLPPAGTTKNISRHARMSREG